MGLIEDIMAGRELRHPSLSEPHPIDLAVTGLGRTLIGFSGWWTEDWLLSSGVVTFDGNLDLSAQQENTQYPRVWYFEDQPEAVIATPSDEDMELRLTRMRRRTDLYRDEYLYQVGLLVDAYDAEDFDFDPWRAAILERPRVDVVAEMRARNTGARKIGRLFLRNQDNEGVDALALDEHGNAASARDSDTLTAFEDDWTGREDRPEMEDYLKWAATQRPYGPYELDAPTFEQGTGSIVDIATRLLGR